MPEINVTSLQTYVTDYLSSYHLRGERQSCGSSDIMRTVLSAKPTVKNRDLSSPSGISLRLIHSTSAGSSRRSVYSFSWPVWKGIAFKYCKKINIIKVFNIVTFLMKVVPPLPIFSPSSSLFHMMY